MNHKFLEHIEDHINGKLSLEDLQKIAAVEGVENLDAEINWFKHATLAIESEGLKNQLVELYQNDNQKIAPKEPGKLVKFIQANSRILSIAATLVLALGLFFALRPNQSNSLYSQFEYIDPGIPVLMSETNRYDLYDALTYYQEENYAEAINKLLALDYDNATFRDTAEFYLAASYLYSGSTYDCLALIDNVSSVPSSVFSERADWLKVLALLKVGEKTALQLELAKIIANPNHQFYAQAKALNEKLS